jgi:hypothetical protein
VTLTRRSDKFVSYFEGIFDELKFKDLKNEIVKQQTPEKKLALKGKEEYIVEDVYNGVYKYFITFSDQSAEHPHRIFVYLKDDEEIVKFKNTILELSKIGEQKLQDKNTQTLKDFISLRKILISQEIFKCMSNAEAGLANPVEYVRPGVELVDPNRILITPKKFLVLGDEEKLPNYEYFIAITDQAIPSRQIKGGLPDSNRINLTACPQVPAEGTLPTEFTAVSAPNHRFDLTGKVGKFITIYCVANKEVRSAGSVEITTTLPVAISVNMVDEKQKVEGDKKVPIESKFTLVREGTDFSSLQDNLIEEIANPHYFGLLRRTFSGEKNTQDLSFQLATIKRQLQSIQGQGMATAALEDHGFRNIEWDMFEKLISMMHKNVGWTGAPGEEFIYDQASFRKKMAEHVENYQPDPTLDNSLFLFFDKNKWSSDKAFEKTYQYYQKAVVYGPPNYLYLPIWKSLGKTPLLKHLVRNIVENQWKKGEDCYRALKEDGEKHLINNLSITSDLIDFFKNNAVSHDTQAHMREVIQAYLSLSGLLEDITSEGEEKKKGLILDGFSLKCINGLVNIVKHLVDLYNVSKTNASKDPRCGSLQREDVFWVLFGIAMAFLPEHFLASVFYFEHTDRTVQFHSIMKKFGIKISKGLKHKAFVSDKQSGTLKLANILSNLVKKDSPDVYKKMTDLGFPFKIYCIESIESLFSSQFNKDCLYKIWNAVFFEGADNAKRRGQQILLSSILVLIKRSRYQILKAKSAGEIGWILHTTGAQSFDSSEFLAEIFQARSTHLVREDSVSKGPMEKILSAIGEKIHEDYAGLAKSNISYLNWLNVTNSAIESSGKIDVKQMVDFFHSWENQTTIGGGHTELVLNDQKNNRKVKLLEKNVAPSVTYSIVYTNIGTCVPQETSVEFLVIGGTERKLLKYGDVSSL